MRIYDFDRSSPQDIVVFVLSSLLGLASMLFALRAWSVGRKKPEWTRRSPREKAKIYGGIAFFVLGGAFIIALSVLTWVYGVPGPPPR